MSRLGKEKKQKCLVNRDICAYSLTAEKDFESFPAIFSTLGITF